MLGWVAGIAGVLAGWPARGRQSGEEEGVCRGQGVRLRWKECVYVCVCVGGGGVGGVLASPPLLLSHCAARLC